MKMLRRILTILAMFLLVGCSRLQHRDESPTAETVKPTAVQTGSFEGEITSSGISRHYILHIPTGYQPGTSAPLVLNFHGYGSNPRQVEAVTGMSAKADEATFLVVYPDGIDKGWRAGIGPEGERDIQFVRDLIAAIQSQYSVDSKQIYATGISNGGGMANRLGCNLADVIAAVAPVSGAYDAWSQCKPSRPISVMAFHGLADDIIPYDGTHMRSMLPPIYTWAGGWAAWNGCNKMPAETTPVESVTVDTWSGCRESAEVILYTLAKHGHSWPGSKVMPRSITSQAVNATDVMWEFFQKHPMP
jgi:polyhydroxybutyrate depolymerase